LESFRFSAEVRNVAGGKPSAIPFSAKEAEEMWLAGPEVSRQVQSATNKNMNHNQGEPNEK
jgi:hypothetical protein